MAQPKIRHSRRVVDNDVHHGNPIGPSNRSRLARGKLRDVECVAGERDLTGGTHVFEHELHVATETCRVGTGLIPIFRLGGRGSNRPILRIAAEGAQVFFDCLNFARREPLSRMTNAVGKLRQPWASPAGARAVTLPDSGAGPPTALAPCAGKMKPESFSVSACASSPATSFASPPTRSRRHSRSQPCGSGASSSPDTSKAAICCPVRTLRSRPGMRMFGRTMSAHGDFVAEA